MSEKKTRLDALEIVTERRVGRRPTLGLIGAAAIGALDTYFYRVRGLGCNGSQGPY